MIKFAFIGLVLILIFLVDFSSSQSNLPLNVTFLSPQFNGRLNTKSGN